MPSDETTQKSAPARGKRVEWRMEPSEAGPVGGCERISSADGNAELVGGFDAERVEREADLVFFSEREADLSFFSERVGDMVIGIQRGWVKE